jgi:AraC family transcriptional regulator
VVIHVAGAAGSVKLGRASDYVDVLLAPTTSIEARMGNVPMVERGLKPGALLLSPARTEASASWGSWRESLLVEFRPRRLKQLALAEFGHADFELEPPALQQVDETALFYARLLKHEVVSGEPVTDVYIDALLTALGIHVLRTYSIPAPRHHAAAGARLSLGVQERVEDFVRANLARRLSVSDLASITELSRGRFTRAFRQTFGSAPHQYILALRLAEAERVLTQTHLPISEIATLCGFASQSHLTTTMMRHRGTTPGEVRDRK